jgi:hypothetical protein
MPNATHDPQHHKRGDAKRCGLLARELTETDRLRLFTCIEIIEAELQSAPTQASVSACKADLITLSRKCYRST